MELSLGLLVVLFLILFPGLIFRRLYFYGEFSKEFKSEYNLFSLLAISTVPGIINLVCVFLFYDNFFSEIDLGEIIDKFKDINSPEFRLTKSEDTPIKELINSEISPFIIFLYISSLMSGAIFGRSVRISGIDTKFKLLRFKNYWFYLFNGQHTGFKKMKHLHKRNKKHLFTKVDILIESNNNDYLYSGIVVDYELLESNCRVLSKIMLENPSRYLIEGEERVPIKIPGNLFVVDCKSMKNINLTYIYEEIGSLLKSKIPNYTEITFGLFTLSLIPIFIFQAESIDWTLYIGYFNLLWYEKIIIFMLTAQFLSLLNPFTKKGVEYKYVDFNSFVGKQIWIIFLLFLSLLLN